MNSYETSVCYYFVDDSLVVSVDEQGEKLACKIIL